MCLHVGKRFFGFGFMRSLPVIKSDPFEEYVDLDKLVVVQYKRRLSYQYPFTNHRYRKLLSVSAKMKYDEIRAIIIYRCKVMLYNLNRMNNKL